MPGGGLIRRPVQDRRAACYGFPLCCGVSLQRKNNRTGDRIGDAEAAAEVFEGIAKAVERSDHLRPAGGKSIHALPFRNDAITPFSRLNDTGMAQARPVGRDIAVRIEKGVLHAGLDFETHDIECDHGCLPSEIAAIATGHRRPGTDRRTEVRAGHILAPKLARTKNKGNLK
nr:hypothetical protein SHINE37_110174 [Rhizobiaceae bacterium]